MENQQPIYQNNQPPVANPIPGLSGVKLSGWTSFIVVILTLALIALFEKIMYDLSRFVTGIDTASSYFSNFKVIVVHTIFVLPLLVLFVIINVNLHENRNKYAVITLPYFVTVAMLTLQVIFELGYWAVDQYKKIGFYLVMTVVVVVLSFLIYYLQNRFYKEPAS